MTTDIRRHILTLALGGAIAVLSGPALYGQSTSAAPTPTPTATAPDYGKDATEAQKKTAEETAKLRHDSKDLKDQVRANKAQLKSDVKTYGKASSQVAADKAQLQKDAQLKRGLDRDVRMDRTHIMRMNRAMARH